MIDLKLTEEEFKQRLLQALEDSAYYSEKWGIEGGKEAREDKGYYNGQADLWLELCPKDLVSAAEIQAAYQRGDDRYHNEEEDDEDY